MRIEEVELLTGDVAALRDFYAGVLKLPAQLADGVLSVQAGRSRLTFKQAPAGWEGFYHFAFNIPENQLKEAKAWISSRVPLIRDQAGEDEFDFESWNAHSIYFRDPARNILEFIARHSLPNRSGEPFDEEGVLSISEIGITSEDVLETVHMLEERLGIEVYDGPPSETFTAIGDENGLLIVVKRGRVWFPDTGQTADLYPVTVTVSEVGEEHPEAVTLTFGGIIEG
jgi:catechol-2,3-dioxygenase